MSTPSGHQYAVLRGATFRMPARSNDLLVVTSVYAAMIRHGIDFLTLRGVKPYASTLAKVASVNGWELWLHGDRAVIVRREAEVTRRGRTADAPWVLLDGWLRVIAAYGLDEIPTNVRRLSVFGMFRRGALLLVDGSSTPGDGDAASSLARRLGGRLTATAEPPSSYEFLVQRGCTIKVRATERISRERRIVVFDVRRSV